MTQHLDEAVFYALLDAELSADEEREARAHLAGCSRCSEGFEEAAAASLMISGGLKLLDKPRAAKPFVRPPAPVAARGWNGAALGRAAALLLMVGAAASATVPGSPVRSWLADRIGSEERVAATTASPETTAATAAPVTTAAVESGVGVAPDLGMLRITVTDARPGMRVHASLSDSPRGGVYAVGGDGGARFETSPGAVSVTNAGMAELRIEIPRAATEASVTINGRRYITKEGAQLRLSADGAAGQELVFEVRP